ncbi:hypothetical protein D3C84_1236140 [compost metagenome]
MPSCNIGLGAKTSINNMGHPNGRIGTPRGSNSKKAPMAPITQAHSGTAAGTHAGT